MSLREILERYMELVPEKELTERVKKFQKSLNADIALIVHPPDIYYFSGSKQEGVFLIPKEGAPAFLVLKHLERAKAESPFEVVELGSLKKVGEKIKELGFSANSVATELDVISLNLFNRLKKALPEAEFTDASGLIRGLKAIKSRWEIDVLKKAAEIVKAGYKAALDNLKEGITEVELNALAICEMRKLGHESGEVMRGARMEGFLGHILSGEAAAVPSYANAPLNGVGLSPAMPAGPSRKRIARGEPVIFDFFGTYMGYLVDMTRTFGLAPLDRKFKEAYRVVEEIHAYLRENLKEGANGAVIFDEVVKIAASSGYGEFFMGYGRDRVNFIGHGVGTEINEFPFIAKRLDMELKSGMVVAVEPKFIFPKEGAVGLENTYLITKEKAVSLTDAPEELMELK
ncbi:MAG: aminopeptidase P family protein [Deferribacteres bacterium]|nr:aminopeptidase P family protein [Deferribacteres bacterium]